MRLLIPLSSVILILIVSLPSPPEATEQAAKTPSEQLALEAEDIVTEWFRRLNALDDWSPENTEHKSSDTVVNSTSGVKEPAKSELNRENIGPESFVESFVELFEANAMLFVKPNRQQLGPVMYYEQSGVRSWADHYARTFFDLAYRINEQTAREITANLFYISPLPWGGMAAAVEFTAVYTFRDSNTKFSAPGAAFFQFTKQGKIQRLRLYELKDETFEVSP